VAETIETDRDWRAFYDAITEGAGEQELFRQVGRTLGGQPIGPEQITLAAGDTIDALQLGRSDVLLDLCCGNGLVTKRLAAVCQWVYGVDISRGLLWGACQYHAAKNIRYIQAAATELRPAEFDARPPTKACMIFALQHFTSRELEQVLERIRAVAGGPVPVYFADIPDVDHLYDFYNTPERRADFARRRAAGTEAIGTWWNRGHLTEIFAKAGYEVEFRDQSPARYAAHYRFDLLALPIP
jgi:cyclopropane fatty-acyl-phospholipid synthase-like methyltransferase